MDKTKMMLSARFWCKSWARRPVDGVAVRFSSVAVKDAAKSTKKNEEIKVTTEKIVEKREHKFKSHEMYHQMRAKAKVRW